MRSLHLHAVLAVVLSLTAPARAAFTTYTSEAAFLGAAGPSVSKETFDELAAGTYYDHHNVMIGGVTYDSYSTSGRTLQVLNQQTTRYLPESPPNFLGVDSIYPLYMHFNGNFVSAFGFAFIGAPGPPPDFPISYTLSVYESNGASQSFGISFLSQGTEYFGFVEPTGSSVGIAELIITPGSAPLGGLPPQVTIDDVSHTTVVTGSFSVVDPYANLAVPEPASSVMLGLGLAGVGLAKWCRSR